MVSPLLCIMKSAAAAGLTGACLLVTWVLLCCLSFPGTVSAQTCPPVNPNCLTCAVSYNYNLGTTDWGNLPCSQTCGTGLLQSPINIVPNNLIPRINGDLTRSYTQAIVTAEIFTDGKTPTVEIVSPLNAGTITVGGITYFLRHFHFHIPSEHTVFGIRQEMELHLVHTSINVTPQRTTVIAVRFTLEEADDTNSFLAQFFPQLPPVTQPVTTRTTIRIQLPFKEIKGAYYRYNGSLTTPPCTEGVNWAVIAKLATFSPAQFNQLRAAIPVDNARPLQNVNGRPVTFFAL
ncbi:dioscorin DB3S [Physcomitrium patens]|uniref:Alpha-carbonic anhydrase domain-containing protein n=1 Tax=Physcomitrium patens TaxID=3218 RepID=A0A7I4EAH7_PHYPA|nr:uncharacterized protein LOC112284412 [Physcomitrium patens]|eukprot:XP_024379948.1 uncharacterized protein LOC112284412 [Physcomitrella patens]